MTRQRRWTKREGPLGGLSLRDAFDEFRPELVG